MLWGTTVRPITSSRTLRCTLLAASVALLLPAPAHASSLGDATVTTLVGTEEESAPKPWPGAIATDVGFDIDRIAAGPNGEVAISEMYGKIYVIDAAGHVTARAASARNVGDIAFGPDDSLYYVDTDADVVDRIRPDGTTVRFAGVKQDWFFCDESGDGGPAVTAKVCAVRIAMSPAGLLILGGHTVRRVDANGTITRVVGNGHSGRPNDGVLATASPLSAGEESDVAVAADGTLLLTIGGRIFRLGPDGRLHSLARQKADDYMSDANHPVAQLPDGTVVTSLDPNEGLATIEAGKLISAGGNGWPALPPMPPDGDFGVVRARWVRVTDLETLGDGTLLISDGSRVLHASAGGSGPLAVALLPSTVGPTLPVNAVVQLNAPARVTVRTLIGGSERGSATVDLPAGISTIPAPAGRPDVLNVITVQAVAADASARVASDRIGTLPGTRLPMLIPRTWLGADLQGLSTIGGTSGGARIQCRRFSARRVDCGEYDFGTCQFVRAYRLHPDGRVYARSYNVGELARCRIVRRPRRWANREHPVEYPVR